MEFEMQQAFFFSPLQHKAVWVRRKEKGCKHVLAVV